MKNNNDFQDAIDYAQKLENLSEVSKQIYAKNYPYLNEFKKRGFDIDEQIMENSINISKILTVETPSRNVIAGYVLYSIRLVDGNNYEKILEEVNNTKPLIEKFLPKEIQKKATRIYEQDIKVIKKNLNAKRKEIEKEQRLIYEWEDKDNERK